MKFREFIAEHRNIARMVERFTQQSQKLCSIERLGSNPGAGIHGPLVKLAIHAAFRAQFLRECGFESHVVYNTWQ